MVNVFRNQRSGEDLELVGDTVLQNRRGAENAFDQLMSARAHAAAIAHHNRRLRVVLGGNDATLRSGFRLLNYVSGVGYRTLQIGDARKCLPQRLELLIPVDQNQIVEGIDDPANPFLIFRLFFPVYQDVSNAGHNHGLTVPAAGALQQRKQFKRELLAAKREQFSDQNVGLKFIESVQEQFAANRFGLFQVPRKIAQEKIREIGTGLQRYEFTSFDILGKSKPLGNFSAGDKENGEIASKRSRDLRAPHQVTHSENVLAVEHHSLRHRNLLVTASLLAYEGEEWQKKYAFVDFFVGYIFVRAITPLCDWGAFPRKANMVPVVVNADDFGLTEGVCAGIVRAIEAGGVTSTTAMVCVPGAVERLTRWAPKIAGQIGAHLQLTSGAPILPPERVPSLAGRDGSFPARRKEIQNPRREEILEEWRAQIETLIRAGIEPTHLDSHHHVHGLPAVFPAFCALASEYLLPARSLDADMTRKLRRAGVPCIDRTLTGWYGGDLSVKSLVRLLQEGVRECPGAENFEVMCHPGFTGDSLPSLSRYVSEREVELAALCDASLQRELAAAGFCLKPIPLSTKAFRLASAARFTPPAVV